MSKNILALLFLSAVFLFSRESFGLEVMGGTENVKVMAMLEKTSPNNIEVLVRFETSDNWHIYWKNPGDAGMETKVAWTLPKGWKASPVNQTAPQRYLFQGLVQYGYAGTAYFMNKLTTDGTDETIILKTEWLACNEDCIPESAIFKINTAEITAEDVIVSERQKASETFPMPINGNPLFKVKNRRAVINFEYPVENLDPIVFVPNERDIINNRAKQVFGYGGDGKYSISIRLEEDHNPKRFSGVLVTRDGAFSINPSLAKANLPLKEYDEIVKHQYGFLAVIFMAFLGGIILNAMPCIFPILSIKALALVRSRQHSKKARIEAILYFWGVVVSFLIIASILLILRMHGSNIGWGFQLQSSIFVGAMIAIFFVIGLMLIDIINIGNPFASSIGHINFKKRKINAFFTGFFAVLIASPCTAPFMGVAIGYTLAQPMYVFYPVFAALAVGYALPFTLIGFYPKLLTRFLPKPGKWMQTLKRVFSIPIFLTCLWLGWVLYEQVVPNRSVNSLQWRTYDEAEINKLVEAGEPVFVNFTAKWCITCLANDKLALSSRTFRKFTDKNNIHLFKADWTNRDEAIGRALERYQRNSIPLYVYYDGISGDFRILPQLLTTKILIREMEQ